MLTINNQNLTYKNVYDVAVHMQQVRLGADARKRVETANDVLRRRIEDGQQIYGVNTGFGALKNKVISDEDIYTLQERLVVSHAVGVGQPFDSAIVRAMMLLIVNYLGKGYSGVRPLVIDTIINLLNKGVCPIVPEKGSVGSSGDLAPAAHIALTLIGQGKAKYNGEILDSSIALKRAGIAPIVLEAKEGLAIINNTACMTAMGALCTYETDTLISLADLCGALSAEALCAGSEAFDVDIHSLKPHAGQVAVAKRLLELLEGSKLVDDSKNQDQYSIRCMPQIHGGVREAVNYVSSVVNTEINSVTDNPLIFVKDDGIKVVSGGNFHGEAMAIAMDTLGIALSELANVADRRIASLLDPATNNGLPAFLVYHEGLNSGLMILQYTTASLVSENKVLAHPSSVDSVPTSANIEDLVSMGTFGARKAREIANNVNYVLAIELITSCQAIEMRLKNGGALGKGTSEVFDAVRTIVPFFSQDTAYQPYIESLAESIRSGGLMVALKRWA